MVAYTQNKMTKQQFGRQQRWVVNSRTTVEQKTAWLINDVVVVVNNTIGGNQVDTTYKCDRHERSRLWSEWSHNQMLRG